jgi:hypothetical protein
VFEPTIRVWRSSKTRKQPANLAMESAEEFLSILPDYTPTVRPPPNRCCLDRGMLNPRGTCSRTATVVSAVSDVHGKRCQHEGFTLKPLVGM